MAEVDEPTERVCTKCRELKPLDEFSAAPRGKYGRKASCKQCDAERHARIHPPKPRAYRPRREPLAGSATKRCTKCGEVKTVDEFSLSRRATATTNDVYKSNCKECSSKLAAQWSKDNRERHAATKHAYNLRTMYGITKDQYDAMLAAQGGACAICGDSENGPSHGINGTPFRLSVDHCHDTGEVRGILCNRCNRALGLFGDDTTIMRKAIAYLIRARC